MKKDTMSNNQGETFQMGISIHDCVPGDGIKICGRIETIKSISQCGKWDYTVEITNGRKYGMMRIQAYGKRKGD